MGLAEKTIVPSTSASLAKFYIINITTRLACTISDSFINNPLIEHLKKPPNKLILSKDLHTLNHDLHP